MGIKFSCECGKHFSASEEHSGKQIRCPKCGRSLRVPSAQGPASGVKTPDEASEQATPAPQEPPLEQKPADVPEAEALAADWPEPVAIPVPAPTWPRVATRARAKPGALVPLAIFLCVVALGVSIGGFFVYLKTAKEIDRLNKRVADIERQQAKLSASIRALRELAAARPAPQPRAQAPARATDPKIDALLKMGLEAMGQHNKAIQDLLDDPTGTKK